MHLYAYNYPGRLWSLLVTAEAEKYYYFSDIVSEQIGFLSKEE